MGNRTICARARCWRTRHPGSSCSHNVEISELFGLLEQACPELVAVSFFSQLKETSWLGPSREAADLHLGAALTPSACLHWFFNAARRFGCLTLIWCDKQNLLNVGVVCDLGTVADKPVITCTDGSPCPIPDFASPLFHLAWGDTEALRSLLCLAFIDSSVAPSTSIGSLGSSIFSRQGNLCYKYIRPI